MPPPHNLSEVPLAPPRSLSPSKVSSFTNCPLAFRYSYLEHYPQPPMPAAVKGTLVHAALEGLFWNHPRGSRTPAAARNELRVAWEQFQLDPEYLALELEGAEAEGFLADADSLVSNYFELEDPDGVHSVGIELGGEIDIGAVRFRGVIDRLDILPNGDLVIIDYKSGRAPSARFAQDRLGGVHFYALMCERLLGRPPVEVRLLYLRDPAIIAATPSLQTVAGSARRATAVWDAIERSCSRVDFRPRRSPLCSYCAYQAMCPEFGGTLPDVKENP